MHIGCSIKNEPLLPKGSALRCCACPKLTLPFDGRLSPLRTASSSSLSLSVHMTRWENVLILFQKSTHITRRKTVKPPHKTHTHTQLKIRTPTERSPTANDYQYNAEQVRKNVFGEVGGAARPRHPEGEDLDGSESSARLHHKRTRTSERSSKRSSCTLPHNRSIGTNTTVVRVNSTALKAEKATPRRAYVRTGWFFLFDSFLPTVRAYVS